MMIRRYGTVVKLWLSRRDTYDWAHRPGTSWPCSTLSDHRLFAEFDNGDLVDYTIDNQGGVNVDCQEFTAITDDFISEDDKNQENTEYCQNGECITEAVTTRGGQNWPLCSQCADAYDVGNADQEEIK